MVNLTESELDYNHPLIPPSKREVTVKTRTVFPHLHADPIQTPVLLYEVINEFRGRRVHQLIFTDSCLSEEFVQVWVQVLGLSLGKSTGRHRQQ